MTITVENLQKLGYTAKDDRRLLADIWDAGTLGKTDLKVTPSGGTRIASVSIGAACVPGTTNSNQGSYYVFSDAVVGLTHDPAITNPRIDQIIARVYDSTEVGSGADNAVIEILKGTESAAATFANIVGAAALPPSSIRLAYVLITTGTTGAIPASQIANVAVSMNPNDPEDWHIPIVGAAGSNGVDPVYINSWTQAAQTTGSEVLVPLRFYKHLGRVYFQGWCARPSSSSLPPIQVSPGYRPGASIQKTMENNNAVRFEINPDGTMALLGTTVNTLCLDGLSYRAEN